MEHRWDPPPAGESADTPSQRPGMIGRPADTPGRPSDTVGPPAGSPENAAPHTGNLGRAADLLPSVSLPKGGGAIRGLDEKFSVNAATGTATMVLPLPLSPGRSGFTPGLRLAYDSGSGNSPFGFGWSLGTASITRKTDKGLPLYCDGDESDVFILAGAEDLVAVLDTAGTRKSLMRTVYGTPSGSPSIGRAWKPPSLV